VGRFWILDFGFWILDFGLLGGMINAFWAHYGMVMAWENDRSV
jgi:hypothetical protein